MTLLAVERIKLFSTRSPWWCMLLALVLPTGFAALMAAKAPDKFNFTVADTQSFYTFGLVVVMVLAALAITTEYRFGTIKSTFQAVPNRTSPLVAKAVVVGLLAALIGEVVAFASFGIAKLLRPSAHLAMTGSDDWRAVAGVGLVYLFGAMMALGVGLLVRQTAGAVSILLVWALLAENLVGLIPTIGQKIQVWLPFHVADHFIQGDPPANRPGEAVMTYHLSPWGSAAYFAAVSLAVLVIGIVVANRRDA
jgi:ABC-2 type transport system permease protein